MYSGPQYFKCKDYAPQEITNANHFFLFVSVVLKITFPVRCAHSWIWIFGGCPYRLESPKHLNRNNNLTTHGSNKNIANAVSVLLDMRIVKACAARRQNMKKKQQEKYMSMCCNSNLTLWYRIFNLHCKMRLWPRRFD